MLKTEKEDEWDKFWSSININKGSAFKLYRRLFNKPIISHPPMGTHRPLYLAKDKAENLPIHLSNNLQLIMGWHCRKSILANSSKIPSLIIAFTPHRALWNK